MHCSSESHFTFSAPGILKEEYRKLEVLAFEMESTIASLEEELAAAKHENNDLISKNECLAAELEEQSEKISSLNLELSKLHEEVHELVRFLFLTFTVLKSFGILVEIDVIL